MKQDHIIQKVFVEITVNNKEKAYSIKDDISSFLSIDIFPEIEKYISALEHQWAGHTLQIPRLELNLDVKSGDLNYELKDRITRLFKEEISEISDPLKILNSETESDSKVYLIDNEEKILQTFIYFLEKGSMPWWKSEKSINFLEPKVFNTIILGDHFQKSIIPVLSKQNVQERIINQLSDEQIAQLCLAVLRGKESIINLNNNNVISYISKLNSTDRNIIWSLILNVLSEYSVTANHTTGEYLLQQLSTTKLSGLFTLKNNHKTVENLVNIFPFVKAQEIFETIKKNTVDTPENIVSFTKEIDPQHQKTQENVDETEEQYIQNAGLILIHPFIKTLFEYCDLLDPKTNQLLNPELSAHLLHYIATGNTNAPEYDMVFEKFLCNIPLNQTINRHIKLSRKHKTQAKNVIESVQHHWNPMKKSSAALLQNEFFQRPGKLVATNQDYILTVERKTQDILLDKLGWGIGLVKLPWQEKFILVNW